MWDSVHTHTHHTINQIEALQVQWPSVIHIVVDLSFVLF